MIIDYRARQQGRAIYLIAGQKQTHTMPLKATSQVRDGNLPACIATPADLDFLDPANPFFVIDRALLSYGQFIGGSTPKGIFQHTRPGVTILGDSGGFQLISNASLWQGNATRAQAIAWLEANTNEAMTLDIPTMAIAKGNPLFPTFDDCLNTTLANNAFFHRHRTGQTRFLSVVQGRDRKEAVAWLTAIMAHPFDGWAVGGDMRDNYVWLVELLVRLRTAGLMGDRNRLHVLGCSTLTHAVMLSAIQKSFRKLPGEAGFQITFDTSNPSQQMAFGRLVGRPRIAKDRGTVSGDFVMTSFQTPTHTDHSPSDPRSLPIKSSRISERLTIGELCAYPNPGKSSAWDTLAEAIIVHHNLDATLAAIDEANSILEMPSVFAQQIAPTRIIRAYEVLRSIFQQPDPVSYARSYAKLFLTL